MLPVGIIVRDKKAIKEKIKTWAYYPPRKKGIQFDLYILTRNQ